MRDPSKLCTGPTGGLSARQ